MKELLFYLVIGIILYYVLTLVIEKYYSQTENFDPSLVPVSSIVSLAKIAQKIVNQNGVLNNPGNLQIGSSPTTPGNLIVTGTSTFNGPISITSDWQKGGLNNRLKFDTDTSISSSNDIYFQSTNLGKPVTNMTLNNTGNLSLNGNITLSSKINAPNTSKLNINTPSLSLDSPDISFGDTNNTGTLSINGGLTADGPTTFSALTVKGPLSANGYQITDLNNKSNNFTWINTPPSLNLNNNLNNTIFNIDTVGNITANSLTTNNLIFNGTQSLVYDTSDMIKIMEADGTGYSPSGFTASKLYSSGTSTLNSLTVTNDSTFNTITSPDKISFNTLKDSYTNSIEFLGTGNINYKSNAGHVFSNGINDQMVFDASTSTLTIYGDLHITKNFDVLTTGTISVTNKSNMINDVTSQYGNIKCTVNNDTTFG